MTRVVLITGASSGIGRATAQLFATEGVSLVLAARSADELKTVEAECSPHAEAVLAVPTDVAESDQVQALFDQAVRRFGRVDAVVHSAAVLAYGRFEDVPADVFDQVTRVNLGGTANVSRAALQQFQRQHGGRLVLVGSALGRIALPTMGAYTTTKWAIHGLARTLQIEARRTPGVHVSLVWPGSVNTPIYQLAGTFTGRASRPIPPIDGPDKVARAILKTVHRPRRSVPVGKANHLAVLVSTFLPGAYDAIATPLVRVFGTTADNVLPNHGNVFAPRPADEAVHGRWNHHWLRIATTAGKRATTATYQRLCR